jgi:hypothetical protein
MLERSWQKYKGQGVRIVGVNVQDSEADARAFVKKFGVTFPSVRDTDLKLWTKLGVRGLPETFFIDHSWTFVGIGSGKQLDSSGGTKILPLQSRRSPYCCWELRRSTFCRCRSVSKKTAISVVLRGGLVRSRLWPLYSCLFGEGLLTSRRRRIRGGPRHQR